MGSVPESGFHNNPGRLLVHAIEEKAQWTPHHTYIRYAPTDWETNGYRTITWSQYANCINKVAYWLDEQLGKATERDTIAYFGPNDPRYAILVPACIKVGRRLLLPDGRMNKEGLEGLLTATNCKTWLYVEDDVAEPLIGTDSGLHICALPSLDWMLRNEELKRYPYDKTFEQAAWDEIVVIHTSGTTGVPKPIYQTNGLWSVQSNYPALSQRHWPRGIVYESWIGQAALNVCPPQWIAGLHTLVMAPAFLDCSCILPPPDVVGLSPDIFKKIIQMNRVDGIKCPPHTIAQLYEDQESKALLRSLRFVGYLGASLDRAIGDDLCLYTRLSPLIGTTESGDQVSLRPVDRKLWYTHDFVPENGHKMVRIEEGSGLNHLHELVLESSEDGLTDAFQCAFWNPAQAELKRVETNELYTPTKDSDGRTRWIFSARKDDLTKLNWLAKFHAQDIESRIQQHADVQSVFVGGEGRPVPYVIVEANKGVLDVKTEEQLLDELYKSVIAGTNKDDIDEIFIPKETILIAKKEKPFKRSLKQVVSRKDVEKDYLEEIEQAYLRLEKVKGGASPPI